MAPRYTHDCEICKFLGTHDEYDLYVCVDAQGSSSLVARYGDEPDEYTTGN